MAVSAIADVLSSGANINDAEGVAAL
jgi:hypothetical protein